MRQISSICIQLITWLPEPNIAAMPAFKGFLNSAKAPPALLNTMPVRSFTNLLPSALTGSMLSSQIRHVSPKKSDDGSSFSVKPFLREAEVSDPYQPIADEDTTAVTLFS